MTIRTAIKNTIAVKNRGRRERGTILILAIAVLAVLSLLAVSYVTVVRIDRDSSDAVAVSRDFDQQVGTVVNHIQTLLAADLFGNKAVTTSVPRYTGNGESIWPSMFEDGEFADIDSIDRVWSRLDPDQTPSLQNSRLLQPGANRIRSVANPDDAWLASTEPRWNNSGFNGQPYFEHFTNLRSAYTWDAEEEVWIRGDGLYVDLAQWFLNPVDNRANAGVDLLDPSGTEVTAVRSARYTRGEYVRDQDGIDFTLQMPQLTSGGDPTVLQQNDERFFVDTTGDLRPDSQWTQLEDLGNLFGLNWVVAARITDASALVNLNTAFDAPAYNLNASGTDGAGRDYHQIVATGETPADVDLVRLLTYDYGLNVPNGVFFNGPPNLNRILGDGAAFQNHLENGLGFVEVLESLQDNSTPGYRRPLDPDIVTGSNYTDWQMTTPLTRNQRRYLYEVAYSTPDGGYARAQRYPERTLLDLHAFWGTNNATLISKAEQYLDGPETGGYLPSSTGATDNGPLRSAEISIPDIRAFGEGTDARPTLQQLEFDNRRLLTTISGTSRFGPVPVVNKDQSVTEFDGLFFRAQHDLSSVRPSDAAEIFSDMVWALAPFATNKELARPFGNNGALPTNQLNNLNYHYGGDSGGPAQSFATIFGTPAGAAYAIHRAGAFTVNLIDALDSSGSRERERPTVLRFFPTTQDPVQSPVLPGYTQVFANARFAHGDLDFDSSTIPPRYLGEGFGGISFIGVDRQPFLVEAHTLAVYQSDQIGQRPTIGPRNRNHHVGSIVAFEIANPWPDEIQVGPTGGLGGSGSVGGYVVRIVRDDSWLEFPLPNTLIPAGGRAVFYWASDPDDDNPDPNDPPYEFEPFIMDGVLAGWLDTVENAPEQPEVRIIGRGNEAFTQNYQQSSYSSSIIPFQAMARELTGQTQVQLIRRADEQAQGAGNQVHSPPSPERKGDMLVDRMTTVSTSQATGVGISSDDFFGGLREQRTETFQNDDGTPARGNFRMTVLGSMHRAPRRPDNQEGFPAYIVEKPEFNRINVAGHTDGPGSGAAPYLQTWRTRQNGGDGGGTDPDANPGGGGDVNDPKAGPLPSDNLWETGDAFRIANDDDRPIFDDLPAYQLYNPSSDFSSVSDVALVSAFSHMYLHDESGFPNSDYSIIRVNPGSTRYNNDIPGFNINNANGGRWLTFGEQLGFDFHLSSDPGAGSAEPNPWFGKLDPTRYRFNDKLATVDNLPNHMAVPLGSRMFDLFTTMDTQDFLIPGMVNINTAARRVLSLLPLAEPLQQILDGSGSGLALQATPSTPGAGASNSRASKIFNYRERLGIFGNNSTAIQSWTNLIGLRNITGTTDEGGRNVARGFVSKGEIPLIGQFQTNGLPQTAGQIGSFLELAASPLNAKSPPFETWSDEGLPLSFATSNPQRAYAPTDNPGDASFNPASDAEEQLALFRSMANIVSTRSDVFMATFVLRGYDPDVIESIEIPGGTGSGGALQAMNDPRFRPAYESRWLIVFDRSNVRSPTDRPRILLRLELPTALP